LPGFHAFSGADVTGRFAGKGKLNCWKALRRFSEEVVSAFAALGTSEELSANTESAIEAFVCQLYESGTTVVDVGDLRWKLFTKKQSETQKLPPTRAALHKAIARAHFQAMVWYQDNTPHPQLPPATGYGWNEEQDILVPVPTGDPPAPAAIETWSNVGAGRPTAGPTVPAGLRISISTVWRCVCVCEADEEACSNVIQEVVGIDDDEDDGDPST